MNEWGGVGKKISWKKDEKKNERQTKDKKKKKLQPLYMTTNNLVCSYLCVHVFAACISLYKPVKERR